MVQSFYSSFLFSLYPKPETLRKHIPTKISLFTSSAWKISWYYYKNNNWGDASDFIANVENFFVCCGKFLEDTIQNNF